MVQVMPMLETATETIMVFIIMEMETETTMVMLTMVITMVMEMVMLTMEITTETVMETTTERPITKITIINITLVLSDHGSDTQRTHKMKDQIFENLIYIHINLKLFYQSIF